MPAVAVDTDHETTALLNENNDTNNNNIANDTTGNNVSNGNFNNLNVTPASVTTSQHSHSFRDTSIRSSPTNQTHTTSSYGTLLSLLQLLHPLEFFVTVDHSVLWQRHIAWSKPKGEELRQYVTQRYASNMVFLSCMLAAEINVFFNSSRELTDMRSLLSNPNDHFWHDTDGSSDAYDATTTTDTTKSQLTDLMLFQKQLRYCIGWIMLVNVGVTVIALVTTFTLWGMVSSISDSNTHALLRSSIGQYVTSLPSRFTVGSLYLFLLWILGFIVNLVHGWIPCGILVILVSCMFFQVVIPLSAFGRLIIHTGAMAKRPVLDEELEQELLPSGLHASLLIRATDRRRKYSCATDQYRKQNLRHYYDSNRVSTSVGTSSKNIYSTANANSTVGGHSGSASNTRSSFYTTGGSNQNYPVPPPPPPPNTSSPGGGGGDGGGVRQHYHSRTSSSTLVPPKTITATIRSTTIDESATTSNMPQDQDDNDVDQSNLHFSHARSDSDEITIDLLEDSGLVGGDDAGHQPHPFHRQQSERGGVGVGVESVVDDFYDYDSDTAAGEMTRLLPPGSQYQYGGGGGHRHRRM